jgi:hypothetical protein
VALRRERAVIEVDRAARQYQACEPENRLVARELERRWEEALKQKQRLDDEYDRFLCSAPAELDDAALSSIRGLAADLPAVWSAATTMSADRQRVARLLLERVVVTVDKSSERVDVTVTVHGSRMTSVQRETESRKPETGLRCKAEDKAVEVRPSGIGGQPRQSAIGCCPGPIPLHIKTQKTDKTTRGAQAYHIRVENPHGLERGVTEVHVDGQWQDGKEVVLLDDGQSHEVRVVLG